MSIQTHVVDGRGSGLEVHVHNIPGPGEHAAMLVMTERFRQFDPTTRFFLNDTVGTALNQNVTFSGTPEGIHDGGDSVLWTGAAIAGTWDFADTTNPSAGTKCVSLTGANNNDSASFSDGTETDMGTHTAITGLIRLETYNGTFNTIGLQFLNNAVNVGNSVNIDDFINTGTLDAYQSFVIDKSDFGLSTQTVDQVNMTATRSGGTKPTFRIDTWQIEAAGAPLLFRAGTTGNTRFHVNRLRFLMVDALAGTVTNGTMPGLAYNQLLGVSLLTNGIVFRQIREDKTIFSTTLRQLSDFVRTTLNIKTLVSDGTNTLLTLEVEFPEVIILDGSTSDHMSLTINDDLSGLIDFTAVLLGGEEKSVSV